MALIKVDDIQTFVEGLDHSEGIAVDAQGIIWCGGEAGQIYRIDPADPKPVEVANTNGFVLGLAISPDGTWMAICDAGRKALLRLDFVSMRISTVAESIDNWKLNLPNYPVFKRDGTLFVSESGEFGQVTGRVFRFDKDGEASLWTNPDLNFANGMALDADESHLYVVETFVPAICRFRINPDGSAGPRELVADDVHLVPDGIAFDMDGNLYCSCYAPSRIYRISPDGTTEILAEDITCHLLSNCTNIAFGGNDFKTLYITNLGRWHVAQVQMSAPGVPLACHPLSG